MNDHTAGGAGTPTTGERNLLGLDPVCGMKVFEKPNVVSREHAGATFYFCGPRCAERFDADPAAILAAPGTHGMHRPHAPAPAAPAAPAPAAAAAEFVCPMDPEVHESAPGACPVCGMALEPASPLAASRTEYVCPMHPEIVRPAPGECPICGMALEPRTVAVEEGPNPELVDMRRRFWVSAALAAPLLAIEMAGMLPALRQAFAAPWLVWLQLALATPVVLWGGAPFFARGWRSIVTWHLNMFTLIAIGTGTAYAYSVVATIAPGIFPASFRMHGHVAVYFEAAAVIVALVLLGQVLELSARARTGNAIRALLGLAPKTARLVQPDGSERDVPLEQVKAGDRLRVRPGEKVPVDGVVEEGSGVARRVDADRRADPGREGGGGQGHRRHGERHRLVRDARRARRRRYAARAHRDDGLRGAALARPDPGPRRQGRRGVRARRRRAPRLSPSPPGRRSAPSRAWRMRSSTRSPS